MTALFSCCQLEKLCQGDSLDVAKQEMERLSLNGGGGGEGRQFDGAAKLNATHLLVSAMEGERRQSSHSAEYFLLHLNLIACFVPVELPDETLSLLSESHADFLEAFNTLVS